MLSTTQTETLTNNIVKYVKLAQEKRPNIKLERTEEIIQIMDGFCIPIKIESSKRGTEEVPWIMGCFVDEASHKLFINNVSALIKDKTFLIYALEEKVPYLPTYENYIRIIGLWVQIFLLAPETPLLKVIAVPLGIH